MAVTKVFKNGNSQAVRIPREMQTDKSEFEIRQVGEFYIFYPVDDEWFPLRQLAGTFPQDFMNNRQQPEWGEQPEREDL